MKTSLNVISVSMMILLFVGAFVAMRPYRPALEVNFGLEYDIPYDPLSAENKLANETATLKAAREAAKAAQQTASSSSTNCCGYDEIKYFPAGSENKLAKETEALKAARAAAKAAQSLQR